MLVSIMANLMLEGSVVPPVTKHNVPDYIEEEKGGYGEKLEDIKNKKVQRDDEEILLLIGQFIAQNNTN